MNPDNEGTMLFFPSELLHGVNPFYNCSDDRVSISGNVLLNSEYIQNEYISKNTSRAKTHKRIKNINKVLGKEINLVYHTFSLSRTNRSQPDILWTYSKI